jgi:LexA-binding, inner membrane-associated putative hydrolase
MRTYSHSVFTWTVARRVKREASYAASWGAAGAALPDLPVMVKAAYLLCRHRNSITRDEFFEAMEYFKEPSGRLDLTFHSLMPVGIVLMLYKVLGLKKKDPHKALLAFLLGWAGHNLVDFPTHAGDARPLFWPFSTWRWKSPVSYWDRESYALPFILFEHGAILLALGLLLHQSKQSPPQSGAEYTNPSSQKYLTD